MNYSIRAIEPSELADWLYVDAMGFGSHPNPQFQEFASRWIEFDRTLAVLDGNRMVGSAGAISYQLTVPGSVIVPAAGVTMVSVLPTHRRRGIFTRMMRAQLTDVRERGEPLAILYASQSLLYGRFGYGSATVLADLEIDRRHGRLASFVQPGGQVAFLNRIDAEASIPTIFDRVRTRYPGQINRAGIWWEDWFRDDEKWREGATARFYVTHINDRGDREGYLAYRMREAWPHGSPASTAVVSELVAETREAYAALWNYLLTLDLVETVRAEGRPPDEPLRWMLEDPRRLRAVDQNDALWVRIVDVPAALAARRYRVDGRLVLDVRDDLLALGGRFEVSGGPDGSECTPSTRSPDVRLGIADLGALFLGNVSPSLLARAGRLEEDRPRALAVADVMFASECLPWCSTHF